MIENPSLNVLFKVQGVNSSHHDHQNNVENRQHFKWVPNHLGVQVRIIIKHVAYVRAPNKRRPSIIGVVALTAFGRVQRIVYHLKSETLFNIDASTMFEKMPEQSFFNHNHLTPLVSLNSHSPISLTQLKPSSRVQLQLTWCVINKILATLHRTRENATALFKPESKKDKTNCQIEVKFFFFNLKKKIHNAKFSIWVKRLPKCFYCCCYCRIIMSFAAFPRRNNFAELLLLQENI